VSIPRTGQAIDPQAVPAADPRTLPRAKTVATRLSPEELEEVETAAKRSGKTLADWLRTVALEAARPIPDTTELLLAEVAATRYLVLNLFHASAKSAQDNEPFLPETMLKIRDSADVRKHQTARKLIQEFVASDGKTGGQR